MCEPHHSVVQFSVAMRETNEFDDITPYPEMDREQLLQAALRGEIESGYLQWGTRIGDYLHFSKLGSGHTGAMRVDNRNFRETLPPATHYENAWWDKVGMVNTVRKNATTNEDRQITKFKFDGPFQGDDRKQGERERALNVAKVYSYNMSVCNIEKFSAFIRGSVFNSRSAASYIRNLNDHVLNAAGRVAVANTLAEKFNASKINGVERMISDLFSVDTFKNDAADTVMNVLKGDRKLWQPQWADDTAFWQVSA